MNIDMIYFAVTLQKFPWNRFSSKSVATVLLSLGFIFNYYVIECLHLITQEPWLQAETWVEFYVSI
jgi:hypothetical protein